MKFLKVMVSIWLLLIAGAVTLSLTDSSPVGDPALRSGNEVVSDRARLEMLEADQRMLQQMGDSLRPGMETMISENLMWVDPGMIRLQEEYQAEIDRMLGQRRGQP